MQIFESWCCKEEVGKKATNCAIFPVEVGHKQWANLHTLSHYDKAKKTIYFGKKWQVGIADANSIKKR